MSRELSERAKMFAREYPVDLNATKAAERAGYSPKTAAQIAHKLLKDPRIAALIQQELDARATRTRTNADRVIEELWALALADPNELVEYRRTCCRHCYGEDHAYQLTEREMAARRAAAETAWQNRKNKKPTDVFVFDELGGTGFDARKDPHPECPECFGAGVGHTHIKDTRTLSPAARRLYAGVKETKDGVEVKLQDQLSTLQLLGRHYGLFVDKLKVEDELSEAELEARVLELMQRAAARKKAGVKPAG